MTRRRNGERAARNRLAEAEARALQADAELDMIARTKGAPSVEVERANVAQAKAAAERAEVDLELLTVRAPIDGTVLQVNVRAGEFAPAGLVTTPLIVMGNLDPLNVRVDIDEIDVGLFRPEAQAFASLRGQAERRASRLRHRPDRRAQEIADRRSDRARRYSRASSCLCAAARPPFRPAG